MKLGWSIGIPKRHSGILVTVAVTMGFAFILCLPRPSHQKIQGKTPWQWARLLTAQPTDSKNVPTLLRPALVPYLIEEIQSRSNSFYRNLSFKLSSRLYDIVPETFLSWVPEPVPATERRLNSVILLGELGPLAQDAVPTLIPLLDDEALQCSAVFTLQAIGPAARPAVPKLLELLSEDPELRLATAVANLAPDDPEVIRTLAELSRSGPGDVRREAAAALKICATKLTASLALLKTAAAGMDLR